MANPQTKETLKKSWKAKDFTSTLQPTPEQKKAGWERKREAKKIMDMVMSFWWMTVDELKAIADKKKWSLTVMEARLMKYVSNDKYLIDWLDRHISKAPTQVTGDDWEPINLNVSYTEMTPKQIQEHIKKLMWQ